MKYNFKAYLIEKVIFEKIIKNSSLKEAKDSFVNDIKKKRPDLTGQSINIDASTVRKKYENQYICPCCDEEWIEMGDLNEIQECFYCQTKVKPVYTEEIYKFKTII